MSRPETRSTPKSQAANSAQKSDEFLQAAKEGLAAKRWNAAGLNAIHSGIASADAVLIAVAGLRSIAKDHGVVVVLLAEEVPAFTAPQRRQLSGLLTVKNQVAYDQRLVTEVEARQLVDHAIRLRKWMNETSSAEW